MSECKIHGEDCFHCGEACRLEQDILRMQVNKRDQIIEEAEKAIKDLIGLNDIRPNSYQIAERILDKIRAMKVEK